MTPPVNPVGSYGGIPASTEGVSHDARTAMTPMMLCRRARAKVSEAMTDPEAEPPDPSTDEASVAAWWADAGRVAGDDYMQIALDRHAPRDGDFRAPAVDAAADSPER